VVFTADGGGKFVLRENAILAQNATLPAGKTFEIPAGMTLGIADGMYLKIPGGTAIYRGSEPTQKSGPKQKAALPVAVLFAGLGAAVLMRRKE